MKRNLALTILITLLVVPLAGCRAEPEPTATPAQSDPLVSPLEPANAQGQGAHLVSPLSTPRVEAIPGPDSGIIRGVLQQTGGLSPVAGKSIYLAGFVPMNEGETGFRVVRIAAASDPHAVLNADGSFIFTTVEPGEYVLATVTPLKNYILLIDLDTGKEIILEVEAGQVTDVGTLSVDFGF